MSCNCLQPAILPNYSTGTTWPGFTAGQTTFDYDEEADLSRLALIFRQGTETVLTYDSQTVDSPVTIINSDTWEFEVDEITPLPITSGSYSVLLQATDSTGYVRNVAFYTFRAL